MEINATTVFMAIFTTLMGIILNLLYNMRSDHKEERTETKKRIAQVDEKIENMRASMPMQYVLRDDFLRSISGLDTKIDHMASDITEINKNIGKIAGGEVKA